MSELIAFACRVELFPIVNFFLIIAMFARIKAIHSEVERLRYHDDDGHES